MMSFNCLFVFMLMLLLGARVWSQPANDICSSAIDLQSYLLSAQTAPVIAGPFSNVAATGNDVDITAITGCWLDDLTGLADGSSPQVDATIWFKLTGIGQEVRLAIQPCDTTLDFISEDSQLALFSGECDSLQVVDCNEDMDAATYNYWSAVFTPLENEIPYYMVVDGFNYSGFGSPEAPLTTGEFCIHISIPALTVADKNPLAMSVYPNPSDGMVTISAAEELTEVRLMNVHGEPLNIVELFHTRTTTLELPQPSGVYFISVRTAAEQRTYRTFRQ